MTRQQYVRLIEIYEKLVLAYGLHAHEITSSDEYAAAVSTATQELKQWLDDMQNSETT